MSSGCAGLGSLQSTQLFVQAAFPSMPQSFIPTTRITYAPCLQSTPTSTDLSTTASSQPAPSTVGPVLLPLTMLTAPMSLMAFVPSSLVDLMTPPRVGTLFCSTSVSWFSSLPDPAYSFLQVLSATPMLLSSLMKQGNPSPSTVQVGYCVGWLTVSRLWTLLQRVSGSNLRRCTRNAVPMLLVCSPSYRSYTKIECASLHLRAPFSPLAPCPICILSQCSLTLYQCDSKANTLCW